MMTSIGSFGSGRRGSKNKLAVSGRRAVQRVPRKPPFYLVTALRGNRVT
jgi:hypothetical protein